MIRRSSGMDKVRFGRLKDNNYQDGSVRRMTENRTRKARLETPAVEIAGLLQGWYEAVIGVGPRRTSGKYECQWRA